jgi:hypothetical protein
MYCHLKILWIVQDNTRKPRNKCASLCKVPTLSVAEETKLTWHKWLLQTINFMNGGNYLQCFTHWLDQFLTAGECKIIWEQSNPIQWQVWNPSSFTVVDGPQVHCIITIAITMTKNVALILFNNWAIYHVAVVNWSLYCQFDVMNLQ